MKNGVKGGNGHFMGSNRSLDAQWSSSTAVVTEAMRAGVRSQDHVFAVQVALIISVFFFFYFFFFHAKYNGSSVWIQIHLVGSSQKIKKHLLENIENEYDMDEKN
jgi:hypothetical protein